MPQGDAPASVRHAILDLLDPVGINGLKLPWADGPRLHLGVGVIVSQAKISGAAAPVPGPGRHHIHSLGLGVKVVDEESKGLKTPGAGDALRQQSLRLGFRQDDVAGQVQPVFNLDVEIIRSEIQRPQAQQNADSQVEGFLRLQRLAAKTLGQFRGGRDHALIRHIPQHGVERGGDVKRIGLAGGRRLEAGAGGGAHAEAVRHAPVGRHLPVGGAAKVAEFLMANGRA